MSAAVSTKTPDRRLAASDEDPRREERGEGIKGATRGATVLLRGQIK